jgi:elongation factor G
MTRTLSRLRNLGVMAHIDAGKTTVSERILLYAGRIHRAGDINLGTATLDDDEIEKRRGITINSASTHLDWSPLSGTNQGVRHAINLIDTPGHVDFTIEVERSLRVLDGAIAVLDGSNGVEAQTETVWRQADRYRVPRVAFVNKMDKVGADFDMCLSSLRTRLGANAVAVQLPIGTGASFEGAVDLLTRTAHRYPLAGTDEGRTFVSTPDSSPAVEAARMALVEACAPFDDEVLVQFLDGKGADVTAEALERALRKGTLQRELVAVLCGAAARHKGVQMLLDAAVAYLPSPLDATPAVGRDLKSGEPVTIAPDDDAPVVALAFKLLAEKTGTLTFVRVYAGTLQKGDALLNPRTGAVEHVGRLSLMHAHARTDVSEAPAGSIVAIQNVREARTGDTLVSPQRKLSLESLVVPEPVLELAVEPKTQADADRLAVALQRLALEDPSLRVHTDRESGQTRIEGMGELHLAVLVEKLKLQHQVEVRTGKPAVAFRETISTGAETTYRHIKQGGGPGQFAVVTLQVSPLPRGAGLVFRDETRSGAVAKEFIPAVEKGVRGAVQKGVGFGFPVVDVEVALTDGQMHSNDSSALAFEIAGSMAFQQACRQAGPQRLEPVMEVEVTTPEESLGSVLGDVGRRRGLVQTLSVRGHLHVVVAHVPLAETFGIVDELRGLSHGRASASMKMSHYA